MLVIQLPASAAGKQVGPALTIQGLAEATRNDMKLPTFHVSMQNDEPSCPCAGQVFQGARVATLESILTTLAHLRSHFVNSGED